jgi:RNA-directed DNA polymerase
VQKKINSHLQGVYSCLKHPSVHGFVLSVKHKSQNANIVQNALPHVGKRYLLNLDLKDFFSSIPAQKVYSLFRSPPFGFDESVSEEILLDKVRVLNEDKSVDGFIVQLP